VQRRRDARQKEKGLAPLRTGPDALVLPSDGRIAYRPAPHGITGTVEIAFCGEPSISLSLMAR